MKRSGRVKRGTSCHPRWGKPEVQAGSRRLIGRPTSDQSRTTLRALSLTVDDEDVRIACGGARDINEVDVVLGESHHWLVGVAVRSLADICPGKGGRVGSSQVAHVQEEEFALGDGVEDVGVMVKDRVEGGEIEFASIDLLRSP